MNPAALQYYRTWLQCRRRSTPGLLVWVAVAPVVAALVIALYLRVNFGEWGMVGTLLLGALITGLFGIGIIWGIEKVTLAGGWMVFERLECGYRAGHSREVWRELMLKYRGLVPEIVASERFHRLFFAVGSDIVAHEELTLDQSRWMDDLLGVVRSNLATPGNTASAEPPVKFIRRLMLAYAIFTTLFIVVKLIEVFAAR